MVRDNISAWPRECGSHSVCLSFMQNLFLGATTAGSCQQAEKQEKEAGNDRIFLQVTRALPVGSEVQICSEGKAEEQVVVQKPS